MRKFLIILVAIFLITVARSPIASALTFEAAENLVLTNKLLDDGYIIAGNGIVEADVLGDLYIAGGNVTINGNILEDLVVAGGRVIVAGDVAGDIRIVGGQIAVYGNVGDDIVVGGGQLDVGKNSVINGNLIAGAGILTIDGRVKEDVRGILGVLILNGSVDGNVIVTIEDTMIISETSKIGKNLDYSALIEGIIPSTVVQGEIKFNKFEKESLTESLTRMVLVKNLVGFVASLLLLLIFVLFLPEMLVRSATFTRANILKSFVVGLLSSIIAFIGGIILMVTIVGIPLALIVFASFMIVFYLSKIFVATWLASYMYNHKKKLKKSKLFWIIALALFVYFLLGLIPYVGWVIHLVFFFFGVGSIVLTKMDYLKFLKSKKML